MSRADRKCSLCGKKNIEREIKTEGQTLYLCPLHSRLCDDVVKLATAKTRARPTAGPCGERMTIGSLFSGIGGLELGLEWAGVGGTVWQVEQDEYCRRVLARHWPHATRYDDVRAVGAHNLEPVDVICGGFPCQDISCAGKGAGLAGERSGLWFEFARIVREMGPRYVVVENVRALLVRGLDVVLGTLADSGYDAEWSCVSAQEVGAPHIRDRVFIVAYVSDSPRDLRRAPRYEGPAPSDGGRADAPDATRRESKSGVGRKSRRHGTPPSSAGVAYAALDGRRPRRAGDPAQGSRGRESDRGGECAHLAHAKRAEWWPDTKVAQREGRQRAGVAADGGWWTTEPDVGRVAHGVPARVDRLRALGNAVVPQVAEVVGRRLLEIAAARAESVA